MLTPTRELAAQIRDSFAAYGRFLKLTYAVVFGGVGQGQRPEGGGQGGALEDAAGHVAVSFRPSEMQPLPSWR